MSPMKRHSRFKYRIQVFYSSLLQEHLELKARQAELDNIESSNLEQLVEFETENYKQKRIKLVKSDFEKIKVIGRGAFGKVELVRKRDSSQLLALKSIQKTLVIEKKQLSHVKTERDILVGSKNEWIVRLFYSFQDNSNLYFAMEYCPGGDLMNLLIQYNVFPENVTRFYIAELVQALKYVHSIGFVHRDVKPDNILIDGKGHVKLTDFGLSAGKDLKHVLEQITLYDKPKIEQEQSDILKWKSNRVMCSAVGTPDYMSPEMIRGTGHDERSDLWAVGIVMYECINGHPPFIARNVKDTVLKILNYEKYLNLSFTVSGHLMSKLLTNESKRLKISEIEQHEFFKGVEWSRLREYTAPFTPVEAVLTQSGSDSIEKEQTNQQFDFIGFTFSRKKSIKKPILQ